VPSLTTLYTSVGCAVKRRSDAVVLEQWQAIAPGSDFSCSGCTVPWRVQFELCYALDLSGPAWRPSVRNTARYISARRPRSDLASTSSTFAVRTKSVFWHSATAEWKQTKKSTAYVFWHIGGALLCLFSFRCSRVPKDVVSVCPLGGVWHYRHASGRRDYVSCRKV